VTEPVATSDPQNLVIGFLSDPASYGLSDGEVQRVETHCSIVFLVADRAYKLKRAIRYASLDYTTREFRRQACLSELELNRRTAPRIYLDVLAINRDATGALAFNGAGPALDYVVVMRRFAQSDLFDHLADTGTLTPGLMRMLGESIARFHAEAEVTPRFGGGDAIRRVIADNDRELVRVAAALDGAAVGVLSSRTSAALDQVAALLEQRRADGKVRRCHGDLRLANVCLYAGRPTLFDCIEFSDEIGCIDVLYDLAFLLMDLHVRGRSDLANAVFNAYLDHMPETGGLRAMRLFLSLRAATRSYALAGGALRRDNPCQVARLMTLARCHIDAAIDFLTPHSPVLVLLGGDAEDRRTEVASLVAAIAKPPPGARVLHLASSGEAVWREAIAIVEAGCSVVVEGVFTADTEQNVLVALPPSVDLRPLWLGALPAGLTALTWHTLDTGMGTLAAVASAETLLAAKGAPTVC
jgi:aminoglycoside phosphotransferase family enzyme